jgi:hypothetical protein
MIKLILFIAVFISSFQLRASDTIQLKYYKAIEFNFSEDQQKYIEMYTYIDTGTIFITKNVISIRSYKGGENLDFRVVSTEKEKGTNRLLYNTYFFNTEYTIAIPQDNSSLTQIGFEDKTIFNLVKPSGKYYKGVIMNNVKGPTKKKPETIYAFDEVDSEPLFNGAKSIKESEELLSNYIAEKVKELDISIEGKSFVDIIIDPDGKTFKTATVYGKNIKLNSFAFGIIQDLPDWTSGTLNGKDVSTFNMIGVYFKK